MKLPDVGVYVDVGACHPSELSNTRWLDDRGWDGLCIEPDPRCVLLESFRKRVVRSAVSDVEIETDFHIAPDIGFSGLLANGNGSIRLKTERLDTILDREGIDDVTLLSVDTEGTELDVLKSLGKYRPEYIVVEHVTCGRNHRDELLAYLTPDYCLLHETACNLILKRATEEERAAIARLPSLADMGKMFASYERPIHQSVLAVESIPRYGSNAHGDCLLNLAVELGIQVNRQQGVFWDQCLTRTMEIAIKRGYEFILTLDHDTIFASKDVAELWRLMKKHPEIDALCGCQVARERDQPLMLHTDETGTYWQPVTEEEIKADTVRIKTAHFGLTMLRCSAFRKMKKPWFLAVPDEKGGWDAGHIDSDISFWANWWEAGNTLYQANHVVIGHAQEMISWPGPDLKPVHQYMGDYQARGIPKTVLNYKEPTDER